MPNTRASFFRCALRATWPLCLVASLGACSSGGGSSPAAAATGGSSALAGAGPASGGSSISGAPSGAGGASLGAGGAGAVSSAAGGSPIGGSTSAGGASSAGVGNVAGAAGAGGVAGSGGAPSDGGAPGAGGIPSGLGMPFTVSIQIPGVAPGGENTQCLQVKLPNDAHVTVTRLENQLSIGSHHFIVSALPATTTTEAPLAPCKPFRGALAGTPLAITQTKQDVVAAPSGVGYGLEAHNIVHLELHYINTGTDTLDISATSRLYPVLDASGITEASVLLVGTADFTIPAQSTYSTGPRYLALPAGLAGVKFYAVTGHTHRLGTDVKVWSATGANGTTVPMYDPSPYNWDSPPMVHLDPPVVIPSNGGFQLQCSWNNTTSSTIKFGESALAEMCFFWGYYYPKQPVLNILLDGIQYVDPSLLFGP